MSQPRGHECGWKIHSADNEVMDVVVWNPILCLGMVIRAEAKDLRYIFLFAAVPRPVL